MSTLADPVAAGTPPDSFPRPERFFVPGGTLRANAESYAARAADHELLAALLAGEFCYVLTSRQMGKSSLMVRTAGRLQQEGVTVVLLDLTNVGQNLTIEQWYFTLLVRLARQLKLQAEAEASWEANHRESPLARWMTALREVVLERATGPVTIFVDEIDCVQSLPFSADEFFAGIRECYNRRPQDERLRVLTFCLLGVATPSDLIRDQRLTPFNIGRGIALCDFTPPEAAVLAQGLHPQPAIAGKLLKRILYWTGGHPYLTQKLCLESVKAGADTTEAVDAVAGRIFFSHEARDLDDNLHFVRERLLRSNLDRAALLDAYAKIFRNRRGQRIADDDVDPLVNELRLAGIVRVERGWLQVRNEIYRRVFDLHWTRENMPEPEVRRQRDAFYRGVRRVAAYSVAALSAFAALLAVAWYAETKARHAARQATLAQADARLKEQRANEQARRATVAEAVADERAKEFDRLRREAKREADNAHATRKAAEDDAIQTLEKVKAVLTELRPLLATPSKARERVLGAAQELFNSAAQKPRSSSDKIELLQVDLLYATSRLYTAIGDRDRAIDASQGALRIVQAWAEQLPNNYELKRRLLDCHNAVGDAMLGEAREENSYFQPTAEELQAAMDEYLAGLKLAVDAAEHAPDPQPWRHLVFAAYKNIGDVQAGRGDLLAASESYRTAASLIKSLQAEAPEDPLVLANLAISFDCLGDLALKQGHLEDARQQFDAARKVRESQPRRAEDPEYDNALALSYNKLGKASESPEKKREWYGKSLSIRETLAATDRNNTEWQRNLAISCRNLAPLEKKAGSMRDAHTHYCTYRDIAKELHRLDPTNLTWERDYLESLFQLTDFHLTSPHATTDDLAEAIDACEEALKITRRKDPKYVGQLVYALQRKGEREKQKAARQELEALRAQLGLPVGDTASKHASPTPIPPTPKKPRRR